MITKNYLLALSAITNDVDTQCTANVKRPVSPWGYENRNKEIRSDKNLVVFIEDRAHMRVECKNGVAAVPVDFLRELNTVNELVSQVMGKEAWDKVLCGKERLLGRQEVEMLQYVQGGMFVAYGYSTTPREDLLALLRFHETCRLPVEHEDLFAMIVFGDYFNYSKLDKLCKTVLECILFNYLNAETLLRLVPYYESQDAPVTNLISKCVEGLKEVSNFSVEDECEAYSLTHSFQWQIPDTIFLQLFGVKVLSDFVSRLDFLNKRLRCRMVNTLRAVLRIRRFDRPAEHDVCKIAAWVEKDMQLTHLATGRTVFHCQSDIDLTTTARLACNLQNLLINNLTIDVESNLALLFDNKEASKSINTLKIMYNRNKPLTFKREETRNELVPLEELRVRCILGTINFVDVSKVQKVDIYAVGPLEFSRNGKRTPFTSAKKLVVRNKATPDVFFMEDNSPLYPNVETIELISCIIPEKNLLRRIAVPNKTKFILIFECNFKEPATIKDVLPSVHSLSIIFKNTFYYLYRINADALFYESLRRKHGISDLDAYVDKIVYVEVPFEAVDSHSLNPVTDLSSTERNFYVEDNADVLYVFYAIVNDDDMQLYTSGDKLVFVVVFVFEVFVSLKQNTTLDALQYLKIKKGELYEPVQPPPSGKKQALHTLIIESIDESNLEKTVINFFDSASLVALRIGSHRIVPNVGQSLAYFTNIKVLSFDVWIDSEERGYERILRSIRSLKSLEVLQLGINETKNARASLDEVHGLLQQVFDECKHLRTVLIQLNKANTFVYKMKQLFFNAKDGRRYVLNMTCYLYDTRNLAENEAIRRLNKRLYEKIVIGAALRAHYMEDGSHEKEKSISWLYELANVEKAFD